MSTITLDNVLKQLYENQVAFIRGKNIQLEREFFTNYAYRTPIPQVMEGTSFDDHFMAAKEAIKDANRDYLEGLFILLTECLLFSAGHDMMFKMKLEADIFNSVPMDKFIYPMLDKEVKKKYNDISVMKENEKQGENIEDLRKIVYTFTELQSLLYFLYANDFYFQEGWEELWKDTHEDIIRILNESEMKIGDFLHALIDYKCDIMVSIMEKIKDDNLRKEYLDKTESLRHDKHEVTKTFTHVDLPITYFLDHTMLDFLSLPPKSAIVDDEEPSGNRKIIIPN